jgi:hypothetical protein
VILMSRIVQLVHPEHGRRVAVVEEPKLRLLQGCATVYELAKSAVRSKQTLRALVERLTSDDAVDYDDIYAGKSPWKLLPPVDHPEPSRCYVTGTGLTHKGSAENRQSMHEKSREQGAVAGVCDPGADAAGLTEASHSISDSMKMFRMGLSGGRPAANCIGTAPEWFYKGVGTIVRAHNEALTVPAHADDGGEESEIAGVYLNGEDGTPYRVGLTQSNEFSDHVLEAKNYLYLAPSKLRDCSLGPELVVDAPFEDISGRATIERGGEIVWEAAQASGERQMCHSLANLEHHHFKHAAHRRPGDLHVHFFGADMFSFKDRLRLEDGDVMRVSFDGFGRALRNPVRVEPSGEELVIVKKL